MIKIILMALATAATLSVSVQTTGHKLYRPYIDHNVISVFVNFSVEQQIFGQTKSTIYKVSNSKTI